MNSIDIMVQQLHKYNEEKSLETYNLKNLYLFPLYNILKIMEKYERQLLFRRVMLRI